MAKQVQTPAQLEALAAVGQRATCQVCGRQQKITKKGTIANHGYTVEYGWHMGTCFGSGWLPREVSINCIANAVTWYNGLIEEAEFERRSYGGWTLEPVADAGYFEYYKTRDTDAATVVSFYRAERIKACEKRIATCKKQIKLLGELAAGWVYVGLTPNA